MMQYHTRPNVLLLIIFYQSLLSILPVNTLRNLADVFREEYLFLLEIEVLVD